MSGIVTVDWLDMVRSSRTVHGCDYAKVHASFQWYCENREDFDSEEKKSKTLKVKKKRDVQWKGLPSYAVKIYTKKNQ